MNAPPIPHPRETLVLHDHEPAEAQLLAAWNSGRMPHAWLFTGPRGVGKATLAYRVARFVLSSPGSRDRIDGLSGLAGRTPATGLAVSDPSVAAQVTNGAHPDLTVVARSEDRRTGRIRRDIVREDIARFSRHRGLTSSTGGWRVVIIDSADEMNRSVANELLKGIEEPPQRTLILLISHATGHLLPTIRSRCRKLHFRALPSARVRQLLETMLPDADAGDLEIAVALAEGSVGRAVTIAASGGLDVLQDAAEILGSSAPLDRSVLNDTVEKWIRRPRGGEADMLGDRLDLVLWWLSRSIRQLASKDSDPAEAVAGERRAAHTLSQRFGLAGCCVRIDSARQIMRQGMGLNLDRKQMVITVLRTLAE